MSGRNRSKPRNISNQRWEETFCMLKGDKVEDEGEVEFEEETPKMK
jgi:hypothetical protein